mmetsp:Transcript_1506/g.4462  ORF Transcript_1506/g.4462 Transcript_1506/m.4462 type:complete len:347 (-) Transcript_1506:392-1432(-)
MVGRRLGRAERLAVFRSDEVDAKEATRRARRVRAGPGLRGLAVGVLDPLLARDPPVVERAGVSRVGAVRRLHQPLSVLVELRRSGGRSKESDAVGSDLGRRGRAVRGPQLQEVRADFHLVRPQVEFGFADPVRLRFGQEPVQRGQRRLRGVRARPHVRAEKAVPRRVFGRRRRRKGRLSSVRRPLRRRDAPVLAAARLDGSPVADRREKPERPTQAQRARLLHDHLLRQRGPGPRVHQGRLRGGPRQVPHRRQRGAGRVPESQPAHGDAPRRHREAHPPADHPGLHAQAGRPRSFFFFFFKTGRPFHGRPHRHVRAGQTQAETTLARIYSFFGRKGTAEKVSCGLL